MDDERSNMIGRMAHHSLAGDEVDPFMVNLVFQEKRLFHNLAHFLCCVDEQHGHVIAQQPIQCILSCMSKGVK